VKRESVQDGIERIVYKCGHPAIDYVLERERMLRDASNVVSVSEGELVRTVERFFEEWKSQRKRLESLTDLLVKEEAREIIEAHSGKPVMKMLDLDESSLKKLALKIAESGKASACIINKNGNVICAVGKDSGASAKELLARILKELGGSGGGSERIAQGRAQKVSVINIG
jgi:alanyl-tRNA synthetase